MNLRRLYPVLMTLAVAAPASARMKVDSNYDETFYFQEWRSFDFKEQIRPASSPFRIDEEAAELVRSALEADLVARGLERVEKGTPHFLIAFYGGLGPKTNPGDYEAGEWGKVDGRGLSEATLVVDFIDKQTNQLVWRAAVRDAVDSGQRVERMVPAVSAIVDKFMKDRAEREQQKKRAR